MTDFENDKNAKVDLRNESIFCLPDRFDDIKQNDKIYIEGVGYLSDFEIHCFIHQLKQINT